jgi:hypothetical protein
MTKSKFIISGQKLNEARNISLEICGTEIYRIGRSEIHKTLGFIGTELSDNFN